MEAYPQQPPEAFLGCFFIVYMVFFVGITALITVAFCKIFSKAGYHWAMGLLMLVPLGNLIAILILAFGQWPIYRQMRQAQQTPPPIQGGEIPRENFRGV